MKGHSANRNKGQPPGSGERGANLVEMAVVTMLLLLLLAGVVDLGRVFYDYIVITNAAREGARYASHYPWQAAAIRDAAIQEAAGSGVALAVDDVSITPEPPVGADPDNPAVAQPGQPVWVGVQHSVDTILGDLVGAEAVTVRRAVQMVVFGADLPSP